MNKERISALADIVEKSATFHMNWYFDPCSSTIENPCGTPSCIAGHAVHHFGDSKLLMNHGEYAAYLLGLDTTHAEILFGTNVLVDLDMDLITSADAAAHLRSIAAGGTYEWPEEFIIRDDRSDDDEYED